MSAPAFTPGPWEFERNPDPRDLPYPWIGQLGDSRYSALACGADEAEVLANARLIAAAPELFEALEAFVKQWNACGPNSDFGRHFQPVRDEAVAALSKARGA